MGLAVADWTGWRAFLSANASWLLAGALLTFLSSFGQTFFISVFAGEIRTEFGLSHAAWGGIYTLGTGVSALIMIWAGGLTDRFRVRALAPFVLVGLCAACLFIAVVPVAAALPLAILGLRFFGQGMASHIAMVAMARWFVATRGRALAVATLGFALGQALLPLIFVALLNVAAWQTLWLVAAAISLCGLPILARCLRSERTPRSLAAESTSTGMNNRQWTRGQALGHPLYWFMIPALLGPPAFNTAFFFNQVHFATLKGWNQIDLVALFPLYSLIAVGLMFASGWALDRLGTARLLPWCQIPLVAAFALFSAGETQFTIALGLVCLGAASGAFTTLPSAFWAEFYGTAHIGSIKALAAAVMVLGSAIGPGLTGVLIDLGIGLERQYAWMAGYFVLTSALMAIGIARARPSLT